MHPGDDQIREDDLALGRFLREEAERIARFAARSVTSDLPVGGTGARRRLRVVYQQQIEELARHLDVHGEDGPRLYGESQRRYAAARLSQGVTLMDTIEERALLHQAMIDVWALRHGAIPVAIVRLMAEAFFEVAGQTGDVFLTFQRAESAIFQEAALLETIVNHLDEAILVVERDGLVSYVTPAFEQLVGYPPRLFAGVYLERLASLLERLNFRDRSGEPIAPADLPHNRVLRTQEPFHEEALLVRRADGTDAVIEVHAAPVFDEDGDLRGAVETLRDRTESFRQRRALEDSFRERRQMHARLLARSRLEAVGGLARSAAHALNNQLNVITLRLRKLEELPEAADETEGIGRSVREIADVVRRLQAYAAAPAAGTPVPVDAAKVVSEALALVRPEFDGRQVEVRASLGEPGTVRGEQEVLMDFLTALLSGARDATPSGGVVELEAGREGDVAVIRVVDHGPALTARDLARIFEPLAAGAEGRAVSLSAGRDAIRRWGGEVEVRSDPERGNVFEVRLPALERAAGPAVPEEEAPRPPSPAPQAARRVLVVDDDPDNASMLADLVGEQDAEAATAGTGAKAIETAESFHPDAALVDLLLPDMSGWEVVRQLKERVPALRVAVVSGLAVRREERAMADEVFRKPIDTDEVLHFLGL